MNDRLSGQGGRSLAERITQTWPPLVARRGRGSSWRATTCSSESTHVGRGASGHGSWPLSRAGGREVPALHGRGLPGTGRQAVAGPAPCQGPPSCPGRGLVQAVPPLPSRCVPPDPALPAVLPRASLGPRTRPRARPTSSCWLPSFQAEADGRWAAENHETWQQDPDTTFQGLSSAVQAGPCSVDKEGATPCRGQGAARPQ